MAWKLPTLERHLDLCAALAEPGFAPQNRKEVFSRVCWRSGLLNRVQGYLEFSCTIFREDLTWKCIGRPRIAVSKTLVRALYQGFKAPGNRGRGRGKTFAKQPTSVPILQLCWRFGWCTDTSVSLLWNQIDSLIISSLHIQITHFCTNLKSRQLLIITVEYGLQQCRLNLRCFGTDK